jgi:hypothetical protein
VRNTRFNRIAFLIVFLIGLISRDAGAQIVLSEIMYHPVEEPAFNTDGSPALDLYEDVHEFVELHNLGASAVNLTGWKFAGGISYTFPTNALIQPGEYRVIAKNPTRLAAVPAYDLALPNLLGPYTNQLGNSKDTIRLHDAAGRWVDAVSYSAEFPWAISADALGANEDFTGLNPANFQYRGRSLERVSFTHPANDPANWLASPLPGEPSPGRPNAVHLPIPKPVILNFKAAQQADAAFLIRSNQPVRIECTFSDTNSLSAVRVEWFVDNINASNEPRTIIPMSADGSETGPHFTGVLPGQTNRSIVRFRFLADRGAGDEVVSPRADDPYQWHAFFVTPVRTSTKPIYDCFISSNSLTVLNTNITGNPKRVTTPDPPGKPRVSWNATQPAVMVSDGVVYDIQMRHHGSRYNRRSTRNSFKWQFPRYQKFNGVTGIFETDKGNDFIVGQNLFIEAGLPDSNVRYVDLYLNNNAVMQRLEQGEFDGDMLDAYHAAQRRLNPGTPLEPSGEIYKTVGTIDAAGEGPYGRGDGRKLAKPPNWTDLQMYEWTYSLQNNGWRGSYFFKQMVDAMWAARGDTHTAPNPNIPALRAFFTNYFDIDEMLSYIAIENWCCPWDDTTQNHFLWQRRNGKWGMLPWDCDSWFGRGDNVPATASIYIGEVGDRNNNSRGPNFFKDGLIKAFREEYKQRLFLLNNTFLHPSNITAMGFGSIRTFADARFAAVNTQCGYGPFHRPAKPVNLAPANGSPALPPTVFQASPYSHSADSIPVHAKTVWEIRAATGSFRAPIWKVTSATNLVSIPIPFVELAFGETYFWRCAYLDADDHPSFTSDETAFVFGRAAGSVTSGLGGIPEEVVLNEIAARNRGSVTNATGTPDWIELFNNSSQTIDLGGMSLSDDVLKPARFVFPPDTRIAAQGFLTVWCDRETNAPGLHAGFALNDKGQTVALFGPTANGVAVRDVVKFGQQIADLTIGRATDGSGVWQLTVPTPERVNQAAALGSATGLKINEWLAAPVSGDDWFELFNAAAQPVALEGLFLTDNLSSPTNTRLASLSFIAPGGFVEFEADEKLENGADHVNFKLSASGEAIYLIGTNGASVIDSVTFGPQVGGVSQGRLPDGGPAIVPFPNSPSPGETNRLTAVVDPDSDHDGIPDAWESAHGLTVGPNDAALDTDNDGSTNLQEYLAGTDPRDAASIFKLEALRAQSDVILRFTAQANKSYTVQFRSSLASGAWQTYSNVAPQSVSRALEMIDRDASSQASRYYRLIIPSGP